MMPEYYEHRHRRQEIGFESRDLAEKHRKAVVASAQTISGNFITPLSDVKFHVVSQSCPGRKYVVDIRAAICDCPDFPRIRLCKHLAAVQTRNPHISQPQSSQSIPTQISFQVPPQTAALGSLSGEGLPVHQASISESGTRSDPLPKRERLFPNANPWLETSQNMHARISPKRRQRPAPALPSSTAQHIGPSGKRKSAQYPDPYSGREQSGKRAKPDAVSAAANARARSLAPSQGQRTQ